MQSTAQRERAATPRPAQVDVPRPAHGTRTPVAARVRACLHALVSAVPDPTIPVVSIADLGILRDVHVEDRHVTVTITPPASRQASTTDAIRAGIARACAAAGFPDVEIRTEASPAWSPAWVTGPGLEKLRSLGISL